MKKIYFLWCTMLLSLTSFAQEQAQIETKPELIEAEVSLGESGIYTRYSKNNNDYIESFHAQLNGSWYRPGQMVQKIIPFKIKFFASRDLDLLQIRELKASVTQIMLRESGIFLSLGQINHYKYGYAAENFSTTGFVPLAMDIKHTIDAFGGLTIEGAIGLGFNKSFSKLVTVAPYGDREDFRKDQFGFFVPAEFKLVKETSGALFAVTANYQYTQSGAIVKTGFSPKTREWVDQKFSLNAFNFGAEVELKLGKLISQKLKNITIFANAQFQNVRFVNKENEVKLYKPMRDGTQFREESITVKKDYQSSQQFGLGVKINLNRPMKNKSNITF
jgi:hypothetical protein